MQATSKDVCATIRSRPTMYVVKKDEGHFLQDISSHLISPHLIGFLDFPIQKTRTFKHETIPHVHTQPHTVDGHFSMKQ